MKIKISLLALLLVSITIYSQSFELVVKNNTGSTLSEVYIAAPGVEFDFGMNYLDSDLASGSSATILYQSSNDGNCTYDVLAYSINESSYLKVDMNLCSDQNISFSVADIEGDESAQDDEGGASSSGGSLTSKMTANKWMMIFNGEEYGSIKLKNDGSVVKTGSGGAMATTGTWSVDEANSTLTMDFPEEGAMTGTLKDLGGAFEYVLYDGAIVWKLEKM